MRKYFRNPNQTIMSYIRNKTEHTPSVLFIDKGILMIAGNSCPEDAGDFYNPIIRCLDELEGNSIQVTLEFDSINKQSRKYISRLLQTILIKNIPSTIDWYCGASNNEIRQFGETLKDCLGINIQMRTTYEMHFN